MKLTTTFLVLLLCGWPIAAVGNTAPAVRALYASRSHSPTACLDNIFNLSDFGALGDGVTDAGPALQNALDALAESGGGTLFVPAGRYAILTPVHKDFTGVASSVTILGVESLTPVPPINSSGAELSRGLDLLSEFAPRTGESGNSISITGLQTLLIKDITFIGTPGVSTDALVTLALNDIREATIRHCEFYGLSSLAGGGAIVQSVRTDLNLEQSVFLGCTADSGIETSVVQNLEWKGIRISETLFVDYGQRGELYGKIGFACPFSWVSIGNAAAPESDSPRREAVLSNVFLDEGALNGLSSIPYRYLPASAPIDLVYVSSLYMNVSNLGSSGNYLYGPEHVLVENAHYGWSHNADAAINLLGVGKAILDQVECVESADRIQADSATGELTVIDSVYSQLDSLAQATRVISTNAADEDPVQYVRQQFAATIGREPDAAAHFFWSDRQLQCGEDSTCIAIQRAALLAYLNTAPSPDFSISGQVIDESGAVMPGVVMALSGSQTVTTETDGDGRYQFSQLPTSGVYTVTANLVDHTFEPPSRSLTTPNGNQILNFSAALSQPSITVRILDTGGNPLPGTTVRLSRSSAESDVTDAAGELTFGFLPAGGNYTVTPERQNYTFSPPSFDLNGLDADEAVSFIGTPPKEFQFSEASYSVTEDTNTIAVAVTRTGDPSSAAAVIYSAIDGSADQRSDVIPVIGSLSFEPGETNKTFTVFITDDAYVEGDESLTLELSDPEGGILGNNNNATLAIIDNDTSETAPNPIDGAEFFVSQQYRDFLNRPADTQGLAFWSNQILSCGTDAACIADQRMNVSAAFFLSIEFQQTGFLAFRLYRASFAQTPEHLDEFLLDTRTIGAGVVVNAPGWQDLLETNTAAFVESFAGRSQFAEVYPTSLTPADFVNLLNAEAGEALSPAEVDAAVAEFQGAATSESIPARARALRRIAENATFSERELNPAFVLMQYFGYLQRNPNETPDTNLDGYNFWLHKLDEFGGDFRRADMVKSFLVSGEYRARFGNP